MRKCPNCNTDLRLFDIDKDGSPDMDKVKVGDDKSIDDLLASIAEGKEVKADIFEDIKNISKSGTSDEDETGGAEAEAAPTLFECPVCGTQVEASANQCPSCGAQFAEEAPAEGFECPLCGAQVDAAATRCPSCGVEFETEAGEASETAPEEPQPEPPAKATLAEARRAGPAQPRAPPGQVATSTTNLGRRLDALRARGIEAPSPRKLDKKTLYKELPKIVNEVKPLLLSAKKVGVSIENSKQIINEAIAAGKNKQMEKAVELVSAAKAELERSFMMELTGQIDALLSEVDKARATGSAVTSIEGYLDEAIGLLERGDYQNVGDRIALARTEFTAKAGGYYKAKEAIQAADDLLEDSSVLGVEFTEAKKALSKAKDALDKRRWDQSEIEAGKARDYVMRELPKYLDKEMKRARNLLLDMKVKGGDLTKPIGILKQASIHLKREEYGDAIHYVKLFRREISAA